jgi:tight adherence protein B
MQTQLPDIQDIVLGIAAFVLVLSLWMTFVMLWSARRIARSRKVEQRLGLDVGSSEKGRVLSLWQDDAHRTVVVPGKGKSMSLVDRMAYALHQASWDVPLRSAVLGTVGGFILVVAMIYIISNNIALSIVTAVAGLVLLKIYMNHCISRRTSRFEKQFVDAMELAARSLRTGHPLVGAFQLVSEELQPPVSQVFGDICQQHGLGIAMDEALQNAASDSHAPEMKLFATSVCIQMRSGGNLADMMERLAFVVRDRMRINRRVRVLTAQTQFSKRILIALPIFLFIVLNVISPDYMSIFYTELVGQVLLGIGAGMLILGMWMMNRLAVLHY